MRKSIYTLEVHPALVTRQSFADMLEIRYTDSLGYSVHYCSKTRSVPIYAARAGELDAYLFPNEVLQLYRIMELDPKLLVRRAKCIEVAF